jgi:DsbC/DsbD-like thiol-disulfide interchange protein
VLPLQVTLAPGAARVELDAMLGVCSDICVPAQARFSMPLDQAAPDRPNGLRIRQALASVPIAWEGAGQPVGAVEWQPDASMLAVEVIDPDLDPASLIAATQSGLPLFGAPQKSPEPDIVLIPVLGKSDEAGLEAREVQLTFLTGMGAFEVTRTVVVPSSD